MNNPKAISLIAKVKTMYLEFIKEIGKLQDEFISNLEKITKEFNSDIESLNINSEDNVNQTDIYTSVLDDFYKTKYKQLKNNLKMIKNKVIESYDCVFNSLTKENDTLINGNSIEVNSLTKGTYDSSNLYFYCDNILIVVMNLFLK